MKLILASAFVGLLLAADAETVDRSAAEVARHLFFELRPETRFEFDCTALVSCPSNEHLIYVADASGAIFLSFPHPSHDFDISAGDVLRIRGSIRIDTKLLREDESNQTIDFAAAWCDSVTRLSSGPPPAVPEIDGAELESGRFDCRPVRLRGTVLDAFPDDIDINFTYLVLNSGGSVVYATSPRFEIPTSLIGQSVSICGRVNPRSRGARRLLGRTFEFKGIDAVTVLDSTQVDGFAVPMLNMRDLFRPADIAAQGLRRVEGTVLAAWQPGKCLLLTEDDHRIRVELSRQDPPPCGSSVEAVGIVETDLFDLTLCRASWRPSKRPPRPADPVLDVLRRPFFDSGTSKTLPNLRYYGRTVRISGTIRHLPNEARGDRVLLLETEGQLVPVDVSANATATKGIEIGSRLEVTGVCVHEFDAWRHPSVFPRANGYRLVTRTPDDIRLLARPPWWTPARLVTVIGALFAVLVGILIWNRALRRLVERRGAEIARGEIARVESDLKVYERTRLAVELHDSVAQNLTGVSLEISAARRSLTEAPAQLGHHLQVAALALDSCRKELRNCLWDLRNRALDEASVDAAIRRTLQQHLGSAELTVRFAVPRERFADNTLHTLLQVVRELVINAVRHGRATKIRIAGCIENGRLLFSVQDNGCGFDPDAAPGLEQGHFGLQGVRDRVDLFGGDIRFESAAGHGTKVSVSIAIPPQEETKKA